MDSKGSTTGNSFSCGNGPGTGHPGVMGPVGPAFQGQPWPDGHWWHW